MPRKAAKAAERAEKKKKLTVAVEDPPLERKRLLKAMGSRSTRCGKALMPESYQLSAYKLHIIYGKS